MIEDRDYMREPDYGQQRWRPQFGFRWSWTMTLIAINLVVFAVECVLCGYPPRFSPENHFALSVDGIKSFQVWQFLTFQFMHATLLHILFNSWTIFVFGQFLESELGPLRFLSLYFTSGILGGVFQVAGGLVLPDHFGTAVVGASAGAMGLMAAFAMLYPEQKLTMLLYFFPVTIRAKYLVWGFAALSVLCIVFPQSLFTLFLGKNVSNAAHLGGMAMGWFYVRAILNRALLGVGSQERYSEPKPAKPVKKSVEDFQEGDVDAVLDKISARGINSLTTRERAILEAARKKMAQR
jgi:membrane associated rhomboid family serine protease